jgi:hypothetical protein
VGLAGGLVVATSADAVAGRAETEPALVEAVLADVTVRVEGGDTCSGTLISGTSYVVTAAHCVLDAHGKPAQRRVIGRGLERAAIEVIVDLRYLDDHSPEYDAAVLVLDHPIPGQGAVIANAFPTSGTLTAVGFQRVDDDGDLLRGRTLGERPVGADGLRFGAHDRAPAGCQIEVDDLELLTDRVKIGCGLIPGASGGGLLTIVDDQIVLAGIVSTVSTDMKTNSLVPLDSLWELLDEAATHTFEVAAPPPARASQIRW